MAEKEIKQERKDGEFGGQNKRNPREKSTAIRESDREQFDKSFNDNGTKFTLGTAGEYLGFAYGAAIKIRSKDVKYDNEFKQYTTKLNYSTFARFLAWIREPENKAVFNELLKAEKLKNEGTPELE